MEIVQKGKYEVTEALIRNNMITKPGSTYTPRLLDEDIETLVEKNIVSKAHFLAKEQGDKIVLRLIAEPLPQLAGISFQGNDEFSDGRLARASELKAGQPVSDAVIYNSRKLLTELYRDSGYPGVSIKYDIQSSERKGFVDLMFKIKESKKNLVADIKFEGNKAYADQDLRAEMATRESGIFSWLTKSNRIETNKLEEDIEKVIEFYRENGHLKAESRGYYWKKKGSKSDLHIKIYEGPEYKVSKVTIEDTSVYKGSELYRALSLRQGMSYSSAQVNADKTNLRRFYGAKGYADVRVIEELKDAGPKLVKIHYRIIPGAPVKVGLVNIEGNVKTKEKVIRRELSLKPEAPLNRVALENTERRLRNIGYFSEVYVNDRSTKNGRRDIDIQVKEQPTGSIGLGAGFSSDSDLVGFFNLSQSNFDIKDPWDFQGGGQRFGLSLNVGSVQKDFKLNLVEPWLFGYKLRLINDLYYTQRRFISDIYDQTNMGGSVALRFPVGNRSFLQAGLRLENVRVDDFDLTSVASVLALNGYFDNVDFAQSDQTYFRTALEFSYGFDSRDRVQTPRRGAKFDAGVNISGIAGGDIKNYTFRLDYKKFTRLRWDSILNFDFGVNVSDTLFGADSVPHFDRQFLGGFRDLRGFEFREASPLVNGLANAEALGGNTSVATTIEYTYPLVENVRLAAFMDAGFVNVDSWDFDPGNILGDAGFGFRMNLPLGPIAIDFIPYHYFHSDAAEQTYQNSTQSFQFYFNTEF